MSQIAPPQSQHERWLKYGLNVGASSLLVIALAALLTYLAQMRPARWDTTIGGTQSLRPQTVSLISGLTQKVRIVSLYPKVKSEGHEQDYYQPVADLVNDYASKGRNITVDLIDPDTDKDRLAKLIAEVTNKYGGAVKEYKAVLDDLPAQSEQIKTFAGDEYAKYRALPPVTVQDEGLQQTLEIVPPTLSKISHDMSDLKDTVDGDVNQPIPSYKDGVDDTKGAYTEVSQLLQAFSELLESIKGKGLPKEYDAYIPEAEKRADDTRKVADKLLDRIAHLGELKEMQEFRDQLKSKTLLVMTDSGYRIVPFDRVWQVPQLSRYAPTSNQPPRLSFNGEQEITVAIATLLRGTHPMVVFVRPGGGPLTMSQDPNSDAVFGAVARRLRDYNFDVQEKDASGQSAMQQEMPVPEPSDAEMKTAIWVVIDVPSQADQGPSPMNAMVADHLKSGGSAMILTFPRADAMHEALDPWGISARTDYVIVHEALPTPERRSMDLAESAPQEYQYVFKLNQYGDHPLVAPLQGLDFLTAVCCPIQVDKNAADVTATPLLPLPQTPHFWGDSNVDDALSQEHKKIIFTASADPASNHMTPDIDSTEAAPLYCAAAAEKPGGARLVVVGSYVFATSNLVDLPDSDLLQEHGLSVARLPGNGELFVNSIFWLTHMDNMLAISPHALQMPRIEEMSSGKLAFWRAGVLTAGLPLLVVFAGIFVFLRRRD